ncbi:glycosyl hydrolase family 28 protein [Paraburkholderia bengalensis]|uniref:glycosyl hydrolase family 28 protein n=1 Tax=Paraburkholderia bengalensis TaxID=2747562 RepID=UPI003014499C
MTASKAGNAAVVGDGTIDGRGGSPLVSSVPNDRALLKRPDGAAMSWWDIGWKANGVLSQSQNNPRLIQINNGRNFTLYRVTLQNAPKSRRAERRRRLHGVGREDLYADGRVRSDDELSRHAVQHAHREEHRRHRSREFRADHEQPRQPGKLTGDASNIVIAYTSIRTGDDNMAIKGGTAPVNGRTYNVTVAHSHFYVGHGMSIGSVSSGADNGVANADVTPVGGVYPSVSNVNVYQLSINGADNGLRIKSDWSRGGLVSNIRYTNVCIRTSDPTPALASDALTFFPYYSPTTSAGLHPNFQGIALDGVRIVNASGYTFQGFNSASPVLLAAGWSARTTGVPNPPVANLLLISLNNVVADAAPLSLKGADTQFAIGPGGTSLPSQVGSGVSVTLAAAANVAPVDCSQAFAPFPGK